MVTDQVSMDFFRDAGTICMIAAAAAAMTAGSMFFAFDIPGIFRIRTGPGADCALRSRACSAGRGSSLRQVPFRIVRTVMITDSDEKIDLENLFDRKI